MANYTYDEKNDLYSGSDINIAIASSITAGGRVYLSHRKLDPNHNVYYSDTDSIILDRPLNPELVHNNQLGQYKLEHQIKRFVSLAPKVYGIETVNGDKIIKIKGLF